MPLHGALRYCEASVCCSYQLDGRWQGHHGEEIRDKVGTGIPVVELWVGHQSWADCGAHKLLQGEVRLELGFGGMPTQIILSPLGVREQVLSRVATTDPNYRLGIELLRYCPH